jgi:hypothetical protein
MKRGRKKQPNSKTIVLERLKAKEIQLLNELDELRRTIRGVQIHVAEEDIGGDGFTSTGATAKAANEQTSSTDAKSSSKPAKRKKRRSEISASCQEAMYSQTAPWESIALRAYLDTRHPAVSAKISNARLSQEIYAARKAGIIKHHTKAPKGGAHTYVTIHPPT